MATSLAQRLRAAIPDWRRDLAADFERAAGQAAPAGLAADFADHLYRLTQRRARALAWLALAIHALLAWQVDLNSWRTGMWDAQPMYQVLFTWRVVLVGGLLAYLLLAQRHGHVGYWQRVLVQGLLGFLAAMAAFESGYIRIQLDDISVFGLVLMLIAGVLPTPDRRRFLLYLGSLALLLWWVTTMRGMEVTHFVWQRALPLTLVAFLVDALVLRQQVAAYAARRAAELQRERSETLLNAILPEAIAHRLKDDTNRIADAFPEATILFADMVGFTDLSRGLPACDLVAMLDDAFSRFDRLAAKHGVEKIKTIGDAYMVAAGLPMASPNHLGSVAEFALDMLGELAAFNAERGTTLQLRVGIHTGNVVAGVIGRSKFAYDVWGDTVNRASRMESTGQAGRIQVTPQVYEALKGRYRFEPRGEVEVKGVGRMPTWFLVGRLAA